MAQLMCVVQCPHHVPTSLAISGARIGTHLQHSAQPSQGPGSIAMALYGLRKAVAYMPRKQSNCAGAVRANIACNVNDLTTKSVRGAKGVARKHQSVRAIAKNRVFSGPRLEPCLLE